MTMTSGFADVGYLAPPLIRRRKGARYKRGRGGGRGGAAAPRISHLYPCPAHPGLYCRGDNTTGVPERFHYTASRGIISSDISLAVPTGLEFRATDPPRVTDEPSAAAPSSRTSQPLPETMEEIAWTFLRRGAG